MTRDISVLKNFFKFRHTDCSIQTYAQLCTILIISKKDACQNVTNHSHAVLCIREELKCLFAVTFEVLTAMC